MVEWAGHLQRAGIRTGILSNIGDAMAEGLVARLTGSGASTTAPGPLAQPRQAGSRNLSPRRRRPRDRAGEDPLLDDRADNIAAARAFGMQAIQYTNHQQFLDEMKERGFSYLINQVVETTQK